MSFQYISWKNISFTPLVCMSQENVATYQNNRQKHSDPGGEWSSWAKLLKLPQTEDWMFGDWKGNFTLLLPPLYSQRSQGKGVVGQCFLHFSTPGLTQLGKVQGVFPHHPLLGSVGIWSSLCFLCLCQTEDARIWGRLRKQGRWDSCRLNVYILPLLERFLVVEFSTRNK